MPLVYSRDQSGLIVAEHAADFAAVAAALRRHDPHLELQAWPSATGPPLYKVVVRHGDGPPATIVSWQNERGEPLPLSSRLLDEVQRLDRNTRGDYTDEDELERRRREQLARDHDRDVDAMIDDNAMKHGRPVLPRGSGLRRARDKRRARGEKC